MRPDSRHHLTDENSGRIIQLGEVRRRRATRRQAPDQHYVWVLGIAGAIGWALWLAVLFSLQPQRLLTYLAFFIPLAIGLSSTATIVTYVVDWRRGELPDLGRSLRRGALVAALVIANLAFRAGHHWSVPVALGSVIVAVMVDLVFAHRSR